MENLLLLPGMLCDERLWAAQVASLQGDCQSITVGDIGNADTMEALAQRLLAEAPARFALAGLSMGGMVALEMWRQASSQGRITRLALLSTNAHAELPDRHQLRDTLIAQALATGLAGVVQDALKPVYLAACNRGNQAILQTVFAMAMAQGLEVFQRQCRALQSRASSEATLASINVPALVLCGAEDQLCPVAAHQAMAAAIPGSELTVIEACGHLSTLESPEAVTSALRRWLRA